MNSFFDTSRLKADRLLVEHVDQLLSIKWQDDAQNICGTCDRSEFTSLKFKEFLNHWSNYGYGLWVLSHKSTHAFVGLAGYNTVFIAGQEAVELEAVFLNDFCDQGYFQEICTAIVEKTPEWELPLESLFVILPADSELSPEAREQLGIKYERDVDIRAAASTLHRLEF